MPGMKKVAVVTGGGRGIGRTCAFRFAASGYDIGLVDILEVELAKTAKELREKGCKVAEINVDARDLQGSAKGAQQIKAELGRIDVLVNNAGKSQPKGLLDISEEEWTETIDLNLKSCFVWSRAVAPIMLEQGSGRIVNIASIAALTGGVTSAVSRSAYVAAKAGVLGMTRALAKELGPVVAVNAVCPGIIATELTRGLLADREAELSAQISLNRIGTPDDIATAVHFFGTADPFYITGQDLSVDGGQWIR